MFSSVELITVDRSFRPEKNREVLIFKAQGIPGKEIKGEKATYFGFVLMVPFDKRWSKLNNQVTWYKARQLSERQVLITHPAYPYELVYGIDFMERANVDPIIIDAVNNGGISLEEAADESRQWKNLLVEFPPGVELSVEAMENAHQDGVSLKYQLVPVVVDGVGKAYAAWTIARTDIDVFKKGKIGASNNQAKSAEAEMVEQMEVLGL